MMGCFITQQLSCRVLSSGKVEVANQTLPSIAVFDVVQHKLLSLKNTLYLHIQLTLWSCRLGPQVTADL